MLPGLVKQLFWLFWRASVESSVKIQISDRYQKVMNGQVKYLDYHRCLRGNLLGVLLVCIFGSYVLEYRMIWSVKYVLQSGKETALLGHRHLVPMRWLKCDQKYFELSGPFFWCWSSCVFYRQQQRPGWVHHSRWEDSLLVENIWSAARFGWLMRVKCHQPV